jgi:hypothetical protein
MKHIKLFENFSAKKFTDAELEKIKSDVNRLSQPGFFDRWELPIYLSNISGNDPEVEEYLVNLLKDKGVDFTGTDYENPLYFRKK